MLPLKVSVLKETESIASSPLKLSYISMFLHMHWLLMYNRTTINVYHVANRMIEFMQNLFFFYKLWLIIKILHQSEIFCVHIVLTRRHSRSDSCCGDRIFRICRVVFWRKKYANPSESLLVTIDFFAFLRAFGVIHVVGCFFLSFELIAWGKIFKTEGLIFISWKFPVHKLSRIKQKWNSSTE